jgi:hypothetical protein
MPGRLTGSGAQNVAIPVSGLAHALQVGFMVLEVFVGTFQASAIKTSLSLKLYVPPHVRRDNESPLTAMSFT